MRREDPRLAATLLLASSALFASVAAAIKLAAASVPNEMIVFFRSFVGLVALIPWLVPGGLEGLRTDHPRQQVTRALAGLCAMYCFFYAIGHLPLGEATLLNYSSPLFIPFIARMWLGEPIPPGIGWAVGAGFVGITLILKPGLGFFSPAAIVGVCSGMLTATAMVSIRGLARHEPTTRIVFYFCAVCSAASALPLWWVWQTPSPAAVALLLVIGVFATYGQLLLTRAYALAPAARIGPVTYSSVVFAALLGWAFWGEVPDALSVLGAILVFAAGVLATRALGPRIEEVPEEAIPEAGV
ncbi:MAG: DMT family transporter [Deltaproteobacteria bacterium]|nr:DMT family transporter [Deltaproteobacteria bacterium]